MPPQPQATDCQLPSLLLPLQASYVAAAVVNLRLAVPLDAQATVHVTAASTR
jgi:hypothetical protein